MTDVFRRGVQKGKKKREKVCAVADGCPWGGGGMGG